MYAPPPAKSFLISLAAVLLLLGGEIATTSPVEAQATIVNICNRTPEVEAAILAKITSTGNCAAVTAEDLAGVTGILALDFKSFTALLPGDFAGLTSLQTLWLFNNNDLTTLPANAFAGLTSLQTLLLSSNALTSLPADVFAGLTSLQTLELDRNSLTTLPAGVFAGLTSLQTLTLRGNSLTTLQPGLFASVTPENQQAMGIPGAPQNISPILPADADREVAVSWTAPTYAGDGGISGYQVRWKLPSAAAFAEGDLHSISSADTLMHTITGLTVGATYDVQVAALSEYAFPANASSKTDSIPVGSDWADALLVPTPDAPTSVVATPGNAQIEVAWVAPTDTGGVDITGYAVRWRVADPVSPYSSATITGAGTTTHIIGNLLNGTEYDVEVAAVTAAGTGTYSDAMQATTHTTASMPTSMTVTAGIQRIAVGWGVPTEDGEAAITAYHLRWRVAGSTDAYATATAAGAADAVSHTITSLTGGTEYEVGVAAVNAVGTGEYASTKIIAYTMEHICDRTAQVDTAILEAINTNADPDITCGQVTATHLTAVAGELNLENKSITTLQAGDFAGLSELTSLNLSGNNALTDFPAGVFAGLSSLVTLDLSSNSGRTTLPMNVFSDLSALQTLHLNSNSKLATLPVGVFSGLSALVTLNLNTNNALAALPAGVFSDLSALVTLNLNNTILADLPAGVFAGLSALQTLRLDTTSLTTLPEGVFAGLGSLTTLNLGSNLLDDLPPGAFDGLNEGLQRGLGIPGVPQIPLRIPPVGAAGTLTVAWTAPAYTGGGGISGYRVRWKFSSVGTFAAEDLHPISGADTLSYTIIGLTERDIIDVQVAALSEYQFPHMDVGRTSGPIFVGGDWAGASAAATPPAPVSVTAAPGDSMEIDVNWTAPTNDGGAVLTNYVLRWRVAGSTGDYATATTADADTTDYTIIGLTNGMEYDVQVAAENAAGVGAYFTAVQATPRTVPDAPANLSATSGDMQLVIDWDEPASDGGNAVTTYTLRWKTMDAGEFVDANTTTIDAPTTEHTIEGLTNGETYDVEVVARNAAGRGAPATTQMATYTVAHICARTTEVQTKILERINLNQDPDITCREVTAADLAAVSGTLNLSNNSIAALLAGDFAGLSALRTLGLNRNDLTELPENVFAGLTSLWTLSLDNNSLTTLPEGVFAGLTSLRTLELNGNQLTTVPDNAFVGLSALKRLRLNGNPTFPLQPGLFTGVSEANQEAMGIPGAPQNLSHILPADADGTLTVKWTAPDYEGDGGISGYRVRWKMQNDEAFANSADISGAATLSHTIPDLTAGTVYAVQVAALSVYRFPYNLSPSDRTDFISVGGDWADAPFATAPGVPQTVVAAPGEMQITVTWGAPDADGGALVTSYTLRWKTVDDAEFADTATVDAADADTTSHTIIGLTNGETYTVEVAAQNGAGTGEYVAVQATPFTRPDTPGNVEAHAGKEQLVVTWDMPDNGGSEITYHLRWKTVAADDFADTDIADVAAPATRYTIPGLTNGTNYAVQVRAENAVGSSEYSVEVPGSPRNVPAAPVMTARPGDTQIVVNWTAPDDGGNAISGYVLQWRVAGSEDAYDSTRPAANATTNTITDLVNGTTYDVQIAAQNSDGAGAFSIAVQATPRTLPAAPQSVTLAPGDMQIVVNWDAPADDGGAAVTTYTLRWKTVDAAEFADTDTATTAAADTAYTIQSLENGTEYAVEVAAENAVGAGEYAAVQATPFTLPDAPRNVEAHAGKEQLVVTWDMPSSDGGAAVTTYQLRWKTTVAGEFAPGDADTVAADTDTRYTIPGLTTGTEYTVQVAAENAAGVSDYVEAQGTPRNVPSAPQNVVAVPGESMEIVVTWEAPDSDGGSAVTGYTLRWKTVAADDFADTDTVAADPAADTTYTIPGLTNGEEYVVQVIAGSPAGSGAPSLESRATPRTTPDAPQNLTALADNAALTITLTWDAPNDGGADISGYRYRWSNDGDVSTWESTDGADGVGITGDGSVREYTIAADELESGTTYALQVAAVNAAGSGDWSQSEEATPYLFDLDVDGSARADAADGIMVARYLLGVTSGEGLVAGQAATDDAAITATADKIADGMAGMALDVDGDGGVDADDGVLIARYLLGLRGTELLGGDAGDADAIGDRIEALMP